MFRIIFRAVRKTKLKNKKEIFYFSPPFLEILPSFCRGENKEGNKNLRKKIKNLMKWLTFIYSYYKK